MMNCNYLRKTPKERRFDGSVESKDFIWFVGMIIAPFLRVTDWNSTNSGAQCYTNHSSNTSGTREEKFGNELSCKQTLSRWTTIDASEFHNIKLNAKEMISPKLVTIPKNRRWTLKIYWRRSGSENSNLDKVPSKIEEKLKKTFMENQTGFHHRPKQEVIAHQHGLYRAQRYPDQNRFEKYLGKSVMNFFNKQTYAVYYR